MSNANRQSRQRDFARLRGSVQEAKAAAVREKVSIAVRDSAIQNKQMQRAYMMIQEDVIQHLRLTGEHHRGLFEDLVNIGRQLTIEHEKDKVTDFGEICNIVEKLCFLPIFAPLLKIL
ncbi:hypothetical protein HOLleu_27884 [Holothuria leucospilota]|uniref:Uncharacterized protein n=1 Tax=Holothuria leucospilota TaxID=206669 RepID=A0A9Q1BR79_HOLLE|nr:hypothetical protein HOLleu_27884 [Holothuria leucospilota]